PPRLRILSIKVSSARLVSMSASAASGTMRRARRSVTRRRSHRMRADGTADAAGTWGAAAGATAGASLGAGAGAASAAGGEDAAGAAAPAGAGRRGPRRPRRRGPRRRTRRGTARAEAELLDAHAQRVPRDTEARGGAREVPARLLESRADVIGHRVVERAHVGRHALRRRRR